MSDTCGRTHVERVGKVRMALSAAQAIQRHIVEGVPIVAESDGGGAQSGSLMSRTSISASQSRLRVPLSDSRSLVGPIRTR